jgi:hypothetical protein
MKLATKNLFLRYLIKSILLVFVSVFALYQLSSQTPKGIAFGILLSLFGLITALFGWLLVFIKKQHSYQVYILAITASTINLYLLILFFLYPIESSFTLVGTLINLFIISGVIAGIILLSRLIKFIGHL